MKSTASGLTAWLVQRVTAVYMLLFVLFVLGSLSLHPRHSYEQWGTWVGRPAMTVAILVFFASLLSHMGVGLRDVLFDYAPAGLRRFLLGALVTVLLGLATWALWILFRAQS